MCVFWLVCLPTLVLVLLLLTVRWKSRRFPQGTMGFLHPSAVAGGGGERVLWMAIKAVQENDIKLGVHREYVLYCAHVQSRVDAKDSSEVDCVLAVVKRQFGIQLLRPLKIIFLRPKLTAWLDGNCYPFLTLLFQTVFGSFILFYESCLLHGMTPIVVETVGIPGIYPLLVFFAGVHLISYTHYPVITSTMVHRVKLREKRFNNRNLFTQSYFFCLLKILYYKLFTRFYWFLGQFPHVVLTNSTWTRNHISELWNRNGIFTVYPPCAVSIFKALRDNTKERHNTIVSLGQFRPEKNHLLQVRSFAKAFSRLPANTRLVMVGGARNDEDKERATQILNEAQKLGVSDFIEVSVNATFEEVCQLLSTCCVGLHTMEDEHFGIVVVEFMASGCVPLAHKSGGVCLDIISEDSIGFLASSEEEYAEYLVQLLNLKLNKPKVYLSYQNAGLLAAEQFSDESFQRNFITRIKHLL